MRSKPRVAVIGAGLTGLSAAYHLRDRAQVVIFEKTRRMGGRVSTSHQPRGEHGAEFLLGGGDKSALFLNRLMTSLKIKRTNEISDWPGYLFHGRLAEGSPRDAAQQLLSPESAGLVGNLLRTARSQSLSQRKARFSQWLSGKLKSNEDAISFVDMLLRGETCAPLHHLNVEYGLGCLSSLYDPWFRIEGGSETLATTLWEKSRATIQLGICVTEVKKVPKGVQVHGVTEGKPFWEVFQGIIIAIPKGEKLLGEQVKRRFHSYISFLLGYHSAPRLKIKPDFDLESGLYTDSPLNFLQVSKPSSALNILRALIPDAGEKVRWSRPQCG